MSQDLQSAFMIIGIVTVCTLVGMVVLGIAKYFMWVHSLLSKVRTEQTCRQYHRNQG